ncbi:MAG: ABC transporter ATP-binding protein [Microbacteriaceae bacterium]
MSVVSLVDVGKRYGAVELFSGVTLTIEEGRAYGISGANGAGKSVLFRILTGFVRPDSGTVTIDPRFLAPGDVFPRDFGIVIDRPGYLAHRSGLQNLLALARIRGVVGEAQVRQALIDVGLDPDSRTRVGRYSLGMKQKLSIAQATMERQRVLVLDEPFNALDRGSAQRLRDRLAAHRDAGGTVVFTSHDHDDIAVLADEAYELDGGTLQRQ